ncbi:MAG: hypothetical protein IPK11_15800 [Ignavibacteria bacterium]|nr:hypothetical protein [Ignavibacteria bacterium]
MQKYLITKLHRNHPIPMAMVLFDGEEITRKANPQQPVTEFGRFALDGDEVSKHKTDPTKADTDGDGLNDGLK